ncbi:MAG: ASCH domain-containing protein [Gammaproteobacteria bacterium]
MTDYPEKTCDINRLIMHPKLVTAVIDGRKTQQRRNGVYGYPGEIFELENVTFIITALEQQRLGDMTENDATAEGYPNLEVYKDIILKMHHGMTWNDDALVWVHSFQRCG